MTFARTALLAATLATGLTASGAASAYERWINVHNVGDATIVHVQVSNIATDSWGPDILAGTIAVGNVGAVDPVNTHGYCRFDIRLTYGDGSTSDIYDVNLCEAVDLVTDGVTYEIYTI